MERFRQEATARDVLRFSHRNTQRPAQWRQWLENIEGWRQSLAVLSVWCWFGHTSAIAAGWWWWLPGAKEMTSSQPQTELACLNLRHPTPTTARQKISVSDTPSLWKLFKAALTDWYLSGACLWSQDCDLLGVNCAWFHFPRLLHCLKAKEGLAVTKQVHVYKVFLLYFYLFVCLLLVRVHMCHGAHRVRRQLSGGCLPSLVKPGSLLFLLLHCILEPSWPTSLWPALLSGSPSLL